MGWLSHIFPKSASAEAMQAPRAPRLGTKHTTHAGVEASLPASDGSANATVRSASFRAGDKNQDTLKATDTTQPSAHALTQQVESARTWLEYLRRQYQLLGLGSTAQKQLEDNSQDVTAELLAGAAGIQAAEEAEVASASEAATPALLRETLLMHRTASSSEVVMLLAQLLRERMGFESLRVASVAGQRPYAAVEHELVLQDRSLFFSISPSADSTVAAEAIELLPLIFRHAQTAVDIHETLGQLKQETLSDALTGLYNRRGLDRFLPRELHLAKRHGRPLSLAMIDLDRFKLINDTHGHSAGDRLLIDFAKLIRTALRSTDLAFRTGGDEFVLLFPHTDAAGCATALEHLSTAAKTTLGGLSFSAGCASVTHDLSGPAELLCTADALLYEDKKAKAVSSTLAA